MQVVETLNDGLKRGYTITVAAAELEVKVQEKLIEAQPEIEMKGFRKGKVPLALLRKKFGQRLMGDAMQEAIDGAMQGHFEASGDRPAMQPEVKMTNEGWKEGDDVTVDMSYEMLPPIPEVDIAAIALDKLVVKAEAAAVEEALANLAGQAKSFDARSEGAKAESGDQVVIDFLGKVDGVAFEGGTGTDHPLELGSNAFIPGFEEQLIGTKAGDEVAVNVTFPEAYGAKTLAGKAAVFDCTVKAVKAPKPAEVNDDLAKNFGAESLEALRSQIGDRLEAEYRSAARSVMKRALLDKLDALVSFDLPASLLDAEAGQIAHQLWHEENPDVHDHNHDKVDVTDEHKALAARRVRLGLVLAEMGRKARIEVTDAEMTQAVLGAARQYPGQERAFFDFVKNNTAIQQQLRAPIFEDKVVDHIFAAAQVSEKSVSKDDLQTAIAALDEM